MEGFRLNFLEVSEGLHELVSPREYLEQWIWQLD
jgi:hypothetical protein